MLKKNIIDSLNVFQNTDDMIEVDFLPNDIENGKVYVINQSNPNSYTHNYFKYPCKFIPEIPRWAINKFAHEQAVILDPFSGSGTTLLEANIAGFNAYGAEIDNLAKKITLVKTTPLNFQQLNDIDEWLRNIENKFNNVLHLEIANYIPNIANLDHWFTEENILKLSFIRKEINTFEDGQILNFLEVCFASAIRKSSNADEVSPKPYVSKKIIKKPSNPIEVFIKNVNKYKNDMANLSNLALEREIGKSQIINGNALNIPFENKFDLAITSPPYINAFDYARTLRLENLWLDLETEDSIRSKKAIYVGTENIKKDKEIENLDILNENETLMDIYNKIAEVDVKRALIVKKFFEDMKKNLEEVYKSLKPGAYYSVVIGDSKIRDIHIESWKILISIALNIGYELENYFGYLIQNHYLRIPRGDRGGKIDIDIVFTLKKKV